MSVGPHVFGDDRLGVWFIYAEGFTSKLRDRLSKLKPLGVTDVFLPRQATIEDKRLVRDAGYFAALYEIPPHGMTAASYSSQAIGDVNRLKIGALELNIEGIPDHLLAIYVTVAVNTIRLKKPNLRLRINVVPWKAQFLPQRLFQSDPHLYLIIQNFTGNMDGRTAEDGITRNAIDYGIPAEKVSVMYGAHISPGPGKPRVPALPEIRHRGSIFSDDLLAAGGYI